MRFCYGPVVDAKGKPILDGEGKWIGAVPREMEIAPWLSPDAVSQAALTLTVTPAEMQAAVLVVERYIEMGGRPENRATHLLDLLCLHCNCCPLDLEGMALESDFNIAHDVENAFFHIDRTTGKFGPREFFPRSASIDKAN